MFLLLSATYLWDLYRSTERIAKAIGIPTRYPFV